MSFPGLPIGQIVLDAMMRVVSVDDVFTAMFGTIPPGVSFDDLVSDRDRRGGTELASRLNRYRAGEIIDLQLILTLGKGDRFVRLRLLADGALFRAYVEPSDDPASLTYDLAVLRQRWSTIFNRSDDGIAVLDKGGRLIEHNDKFLELFRLRSDHGILLANEALTGRVLADLLPVELGPLTLALRATTADVHLVLPFGIDMLDIKARTLRDETFVLVRDITEQRQVELRDAMIHMDLQRAARFQRSILPPLPRIEGLELGLVYEPLDAVGGDVYDVVVLPDRTLRLFIADATGHGIAAAFATILIKTEYDAIKLLGMSPSKTLHELNNRISRTHAKLELLLSGAIVDLDLDHGMIRYANGGHPGVLVVRDAEIETLEEDGALIGMRSDLPFPEWERELGAWDSIVLVTDGVEETRDVAGRPFGGDKLHAAIRTARHEHRNIATEVLRRVRAHQNIAEAYDDVTLLSVTRSSLDREQTRRQVG